MEEVPDPKKFSKTSAVAVEKRETEQSEIIMSEKKQIHWLAPTSMLALWFTGIMLAMGHHLFYRSLDQKPVSDLMQKVQLFGIQYSSQQVNTSVGTLFALLVRACLSGTIAVAFTQLCWHMLFASSSSSSNPSSPLRLDTVDAAFSSLSHFSSLLDRRLWLRSPVLLVLAIVTWLLAVPTVITPGTISVQSSKYQRQLSLKIPNLNFTNFAYLGGMFMDPNQGLDAYSPSYYYNGPSQAVEKAAFAVAAQGSILPIFPPTPNASWTSTFHGPSIQCEPMDSARSLRIQQNIANYTAIQNNCGIPYVYYGWYGDLPFTGQSPNMSLSSASLVSEQGPVTLQSWGGGINATINFAILPGMRQNMLMATHSLPMACVLLAQQKINMSAPLGSLAKDSTMLQCQLVNSTYQVSYNYTNSLQNITVETSNTSPVTTVGQVEGPDYLHWIQAKLAHNSTEPFLVPCLVRGFGNYSDINATGVLTRPKCTTFDSEILQTLSYQAVMDAFGKLLAGDVAVRGTYGYVANSSILNTILTNTAELSFLSDGAIESQVNDSALWYNNNGIGSLPDLQNVMKMMFGQNSSGIPSNTTTAPMSSFSQAVEELFQNFTISLMSSVDLEPQLSDEALLHANVTDLSYHNVYVYSARRLWAAYSIAIFFTTLAALAGIWSIFANGASYSSKFSTILRVANKAYISEELTLADAAGQDPLPQRLATAAIVLPTNSIAPSARLTQRLYTYDRVAENERHD